MMRLFRRHTLLLVLLFALAGSSASCRCNKRAARPQRPNIIVVLSDALRAASLPLYGYPRETAPNLSALAKESITFGSHFAHYPGTSVSISQLHTGRVMAPLLVTYKYMAIPVRSLPPDLLLLPQELGQAGYRTAMVTAHYWLTGEQSWLVRYFEDWKYLPPPTNQSYAFFADLWPHITGALDRAADDDRPFFLYLHTFDTHGPNDFHPGFDSFRDDPNFPEPYNRYDSEILYTDHWLGKLVEELRQRDLLDNTILVFTSDHGDDFNEVGPESWNSNHGPFTRRSLLHVPFVMRLPQGRAAGLRYEGVTRHVDIAPTLLKLAMPAYDLSGLRFDGEDLSPEILAGNDGRDRQRTSISFTPRYWGLARRDVELTYDQWSGELSPLQRPEPDALNYPRLVPIEDAALRSQLGQELAAERLQKIEEFVHLPPTTEAPNPALVGFMLPITVVEDPSPEHGPVLEDNPTDQRWTFHPSYISAAPGEKVPPLTLWTPWVPGTYKASILLQRDRSGWSHHFTFQIGNGENPAVRVRGRDAPADGWFDLGTQEIGERLRMTFRDPRGGVKAIALRLERIGSPLSPLSTTPDAAVRERLRVLGYVE